MIQDKEKPTNILTCITKMRTAEEEITKDNIFSHILISIFSSCFSLLCIFLMETTNLIFMGKTTDPSLSNIYVDSVGLGNIYLNFVGVLIGFGVLGGLDTMGSHAYGSYQYEQLGIYTVRTRFILIGVFFFITLPISIFSDKLLLFINIKPELVSTSYNYIVYMLPTVILTFNFNLNMRYLQVMQIYMFPALITMTALVIHIIVCYFFVVIFSKGIMGLCVASAITMSYCLIASTAYIIYKNPMPRSLFLYPPASTFDYKDFSEFIKLCFYSGVQHYGDYIGYEIVCLMCSYLEESSMAATLIVLNFANVIGYIYVGFSFPLSHMIGLFLGRKDFSMYYHCVKVYSWIYTLTALILSSFVYLFSNVIPYFYSDNADAILISTDIFTMWTVGVFCDVYNIMYQAILRGAGKQKVTSIWNILMSIFFMIPLSYLLCFASGLGVIGIWLGCISYTLILALVNFCYFISLDVHKASQIIAEQIEKEEVSKRVSIFSYTELSDLRQKF